MKAQVTLSEMTMKRSADEQHSQLDILQKDLNTSSPVYCRGTRAKNLNSVLFCPGDWRPWPCEPDLLIRSTKCNKVHFFVVLQCVLQPVVVCWCKPVLKFEDFWCTSKCFYSGGPEAKRLAWGTSPKWPILCWVGCKTATQSISQTQKVISWGMDLTVCIVAVEKKSSWNKSWMWLFGWCSGNFSIQRSRQRSVPWYCHWEVVCIAWWAGKIWVRNWMRKIFRRWENSLFTTGIV